MIMAIEFRQIIDIFCRARTSLVLIILLFKFMVSVAQEDWEKESGEIQSGEFVIEKDKKIELPHSNRLFNKIPPPPVNPGITTLNYKYSEIDFMLNSLTPRLRVLTISGEELTKLYGNFVSGGFGNFSSPYLEGYFGSKRTATSQYGLSFHHLSSVNGPVDRKNSANGNTRIGLTGKSFNEYMTLEGDLIYRRSNMFFYGYDTGIPVNRDTIEQIFNVFDAKIGIQANNPENSWHPALYLSYYYVTDNFSAKEGEFSIELKQEFEIDDQSSFDLDASLSLISREDQAVASNTRNLLKINPRYNFRLSNFEINAGLRGVVENDKVQNADKFHVYPDINAYYYLNHKTRIYGGITGDIEKKTLGNLVNENPFLTPNIEIYHTNKEIDIFGGLKGQVTSILGFDLGISLSSLKNSGYYINDTTQFNKFTLIYDLGSVTLVNPFLQLSYNKSTKSNLKLRLDLYEYSTDSVTQPWHKPSFKATFNSRFNVYDKIFINADINYLSGIKVADFSKSTDGTFELDAITDISLKLDYLFSKQFSVFLSINNLLSDEYEKLNRYPVRGLQALGGVSYSF